MSKPSTSSGSQVGETTDHGWGECGASQQHQRSGGRGDDLGLAIVDAAAKPVEAVEAGIGPKLPGDAEHRVSQAALPHHVVEHVAHHVVQPGRGHHLLQKQAQSVVDPIAAHSVEGLQEGLEVFILRRVLAQHGPPSHHELEDPSLAALVRLAQRDLHEVVGDTCGDAHVEIEQQPGVGQAGGEAMVVQEPTGQEQASVGPMRSAGENTMPAHSALRCWTTRSTRPRLP